MNNIETRQFATELRMDGNTLTGYAAKFDSLSLDLGGFREKITHGAFAQSIEDGDIRAFWNHDTNRLPLGRTSSGTLHLEEDEVGLRFQVDLPETQDAQDLKKSVMRGDVDGVSFGFRTREDSWEEKGTLRTLVDVELLEISPVNYPAYPSTELALRSREAHMANVEAEEDLPSVEEQNKKIRQQRAKRILEIVELQDR